MCCFLYNYTKKGKMCYNACNLKTLFQIIDVLKLSVFEFLKAISLFFKI